MQLGFLTISPEGGVAMTVPPAELMINKTELQFEVMQVAPSEQCRSCGQEWKQNMWQCGHAFLVLSVASETRNLVS